METADLFYYVPELVEPEKRKFSQEAEEIKRLRQRQLPAERPKDYRKRKYYAEKEMAFRFCECKIFHRPAF
ncbi:MAG: hypothetical protein U0X87_07900 [Anaerolineales bacterium]